MRGISLFKQAPYVGSDIHLFALKLHSVPLRPAIIRFMAG